MALSSVDGAYIIQNLDLRETEKNLDFDKNEDYYLKSFVCMSPFTRFIWNQAPIIETNKQKEFTLDKKDEKYR